MTRYDGQKPEIHIKDVPEREPEETSISDIASLPWATKPWNQCKAIREERTGDGGYWGRCDLRRNHDGIDHALERGMDIPRWSTDWTA